MYKLTVNFKVQVSREDRVALNLGRGWGGGSTLAGVFINKGEGEPLRTDFNLKSFYLSTFIIFS